MRAFTPEVTVSIVQTHVELRDPCARAKFVAVLAADGITAAVMFRLIGIHVPDGFEPLGDTDYFILPVNARTIATPASCSGITDITRSSSKSVAH